MTLECILKGRGNLMNSPTLTTIVGLMIALSVMGCVSTVLAQSQSSGAFDLNQLLLAGDVAKVNEAVEVMQLDSVTKQMAQAQVTYKLADVLALALTCRDEGMRRDLLPQALGCNTVAYRAALILGDARQTFSALSWAKQTGFPAALRAGLGQSTFGNSFDHSDVTLLSKSLPPTFETMATGYVTIPYTNASLVVSNGEGADALMRSGDLRTIPAINISINQKPAEAIADTGLSYAIVMDQAHADSLGVRVLVTDLPPLPAMGKGAIGSSQSLGLITQMSVGPLTLHNILVAVIPSGHPDTDRVAIGVPLLARFRQLEFGSTGITVGRLATPCPAPLTMGFASSWNEDGKLVVDAEADGRNVKASIDTGAAPPLVAGSQLLPRRAGQDAPVSRLTRKLTVKLGRQALSYDHTPIIAQIAAPAFFVGAPILSKFDLQFDFDKPSLCVAGRTAKTFQ